LAFSQKKASTLVKYGEKKKGGILASGYQNTIALTKHKGMEKGKKLHYPFSAGKRAADNKENISSKWAIGNRGRATGEGGIGERRICMKNSSRTNSHPRGPAMTSDS